MDCFSNLVYAKEDKLYLDSLSYYPVWRNSLYQGLSAKGGIKLLRNGNTFFSLWYANFYIYFTVIVMLIVGIGFGAMANNALDQPQKTELMSMLNNLVHGLSTNTNLGEDMVVKDEVWQSLFLVGLIWFLGLTVIGIPLIAIIVFLRGFVLGFAVGFLVRELSYRGILIALAAVVPANLIAIPAIILTGVTSVSFSTQLFRTRGNRHPQFTLNTFLQYTGTMAVNAAILVMSVFVSGYVSPVFMKWMIRWLV